MPHVVGCGAYVVGNVRFLYQRPSRSGVVDLMVPILSLDGIPFVEQLTCEVKELPAGRPL